MRYGSYDIEIIKAIPPKNDSERIDGIEYCAGWKDFEDMGIACVWVSDSEGEMEMYSPQLFGDTQYEQIQDALRRLDVVVSFNGKGMDRNLLAANGITYPAERDYDILWEFWEAAGIGTTFEKETHGGCGLGTLSELNFGDSKIGQGELAPIWWQRGEFQRVIEYCADDVKKTDRLFAKVLAEETILGPPDRYPELVLRRPF